mmetsp:Transcript_14369/g.41032  ORF Transcript_14369/g.41032 Transcript_14369/m.41032 type:complete len:263 (+) Transcript_14369:247-1035(+)
MIPERPTLSLNSLAWFSMFIPVVPSSTSSVSCGAPSRHFPMLFLHFANSSMRPQFVCSLPLVSHRTRSMSFSTAFATALYRTVSGLVLSSSARTISALLLLAHWSNCSPAAALNVSPAASITDAPWLANLCAILPIVVVFPPPFTPTTSNTDGFSLLNRSSLSPERMSTMSFFKLSRISSPDLSSPLSTFSRIWSTILNAVPGPKSAIMRASSSSSSSESASSRFQRTNSSSRTPSFARVRSVPDTSFPKSRPFSWMTRLIF